jgi:hypothetical protein
VPPVIPVVKVPVVPDTAPENVPVVPETAPENVPVVPETAPENTPVVPATDPAIVKPVADSVDLATPKIAVLN